MEIWQPVFVKSLTAILQSHIADIDEQRLLAALICIDRGDLTSAHLDKILSVNKSRGGWASLLTPQQGCCKADARGWRNTNPVRVMVFQLP